MRSQHPDSEAARERPIKEFPFYAKRLHEIDYKAIIDARKPWRDPYFKADINSILDPTMMRSERLKNWETYTWKRPADAFKGNNFTIYNEISPTDIKQGDCGDCYILSSISSLAEFPERVKDIFITKEVNEAGCYAVKLYINGEPEVVVVDDYFPWCSHKDNWAFSRSSADQEIWVLILEKAWAKVYGSYQRIEGGNIGEALPALTGAPTDVLMHEDIQNKEQIWNEIKLADERKYVIATSVSSDQSRRTHDLMKSMGLVDAHAYSLISAHTVRSGLQTVRLLKIRNPWGRREWNGDWSDFSSKWTPDLQRQVGFEAKEDGIFFISFEDYVTFFYITSICRYQNGGDLSVAEDEHKIGDYCVQKFSITQNYKTPIIITLNQVHSRLADETMRGTYQYAPIKIVLAKVLSRSNG